MANANVSISLALPQSEASMAVNSLSCRCYKLNVFVFCTVDWTKQATSYLGEIAVGTSSVF